jgi:hypothetical protein
VRHEQIAQGVLSTDGVGPCWVIVVFLACNRIYIQHLTSTQLPPRVGFYWAQVALQRMVRYLVLKITETTGDQEIVHVCLFGERYKRNDDMTSMGFMVKILCSTPSEVLLFKTNYARPDRLLDFMNKV